MVQFSSSPPRLLAAQESWAACFPETMVLLQLHLHLRPSITSFPLLSSGVVSFLTHRSSVVGLNALALISCQPCLRSPLRRIRMGEARATNGQVPELQEHWPITPRRTVIEHVTLFQMRKDLTEEQEKDMLDHLYTLQYQMRGIIAISLGRISNEDSSGCTHALFTRFPSKEALDVYYDNPARWRIMNEYIIPFYHGLFCIDFEAEVEDDILPIFRRGEDFEEGVEYLAFLQVKEGIESEVIKLAFHSLSGLVDELGSLVIQHTSGKNFSSHSNGYTHGTIIRFPSDCGFQNMKEGLIGSSLRRVLSSPLRGLQLGFF